jgi:hypothetical protein
MLKMNKKNIARVIENKADIFDTRILEICFPSAGYLCNLFTPRLENIAFVKIDNSITVNLKNTSFREYFNEWVMSFLQKLNKSHSIEDVVFNFNMEIKAIVMLGRKEKHISWESARGLYGELLVVKELLINRSFAQTEILNSWHRPSPAAHDFDFPSFSLEIKTISRANTTVKISSVHQLETVDNKPLKLRCIRIEKIEMSNEDSLGILFNEIEAMLDPICKINFEIKCAEDAYCKYLGPDFMPLDYKFLIIDNFLYNVDQVKFPRVKKNELNIAISNLSYSLDVSSFDEFKIIENGY